MALDLPELHVVAAVLADRQGRVLLACRPRGREDAGLWEFPGGKVEPGESQAAALARELYEELELALASAEALISVPLRQPGRLLWLHALRCQVRGSPCPREGQALRWSDVADIDPALMPPADRPVLAALREPDALWITPSHALTAAPLQRLLADAATCGCRRLLLRQPQASAAQLRELAVAAAPQARALGIELLLGARSEAVLALCAELGLGAQLAECLAARLPERPAGLSRLGASCHDAAGLSRAQALGCDYATLSPVQPTPTHPEAPALGWAGFSLHRSACALPVYALGGVGPQDHPQARAAGAQGVAGIRAFFAAP